jgi:hypothetical protein
MCMEGLEKSLTYGDGLLRKSWDSWPSTLYVSHWTVIFPYSSFMWYHVACRVFSFYSSHSNGIATRGEYYSLPLTASLSVP